MAGEKKMNEVVRKNWFLLLISLLVSIVIWIYVSYVVNPTYVKKINDIPIVYNNLSSDFESGKLLQRAKALVPLLVPLVVSAFRRANDLALAMEARCYHGGDGRTKMKPLKYKRRDFIAYLILFGYLGLVIGSGFLF